MVRDVNLGNGKQAMRGVLPAKWPVKQFQANLLAWYDKHARGLPWREDRDPYRVWVSEIMLQQTRVAAVIAHYREFLRRFPNVKKLAAAREASVLAAWSGLGYYRRARMLHRAAKVVARKMDGKFPRSASELRDLPGIGRYTAAAIASIAFDEAAAVVDGNVERVVQRLTGRRMAGKELWMAAKALLDANRPGDFNQAMMELGATVCTPQAPACLLCPVNDTCATRGKLEGGAKAAPQQKREIHYALVCREEEVFLVQRARDARLMAGMWELPQVAGPAEDAGQRVVDRPRLANRRNGISGGKHDHALPVFRLRHSITVTDYTVNVWRVAAPPEVAGRWIAIDRLERMALTGLARKILGKAAML